MVGDRVLLKSIQSVFDSLPFHRSCTITRAGALECEFRPSVRTRRLSGGLSIVGAMLMLDLAGYFLDLRLGTAPRFALAGYAFGLCVVLYAVVTAHRHQ